MQANRLALTSMNNLQSSEVQTRKKICFKIERKLLIHAVCYLGYTQTHTQDIDTKTMGYAAVYLFFLQFLLRCVACFPCLPLKCHGTKVCSNLAFHTQVAARTPDNIRVK